jgi:sugar-specific transcriptional regulator TrmB
MLKQEIQYWEDKVNACLAIIGECETTLKRCGEEPSERYSKTAEETAKRMIESNKNELVISTNHLQELRRKCQSRGQ